MISLICQAHLLNSKTPDCFPKVDSARALGTQVKAPGGQVLGVHALPLGRNLLLPTLLENNSCFFYCICKRASGAQSSCILRKEVGMKSTLMLQIKLLFNRRKIGSLNNEYYSHCLFLKAFSYRADTGYSMLYLHNPTGIS